MWESNNGSYYGWQGNEGEDRDLVASLIHHGPEDGVNPHKWGVQIHPTDGGIVVIGYIRESVFDAEIARALADLALSEKQPFAWWTANSAEWWMQHYINSLSI